MVKYASVFSGTSEGDAAVTKQKTSEEIINIEMNRVRRAGTVLPRDPSVTVGLVKVEVEVNGGTLCGGTL